MAIATGELGKLLPDLIEALGGEGRTALGEGLPAALQQPAEVLGVRLAAKGQGGPVTGPKEAPADSDPDSAPF
ncbi:hypothetical protein D3C80_2195640 [compost metagenome]